jgi:hypothetical protein
MYLADGLTDLGFHVILGSSQLREGLTPHQDCGMINKC